MIETRIVPIERRPPGADSLGTVMHVFAAKRRAVIITGGSRNYPETAVVDVCGDDYTAYRREAEPIDLQDADDDSRMVTVFRNRASWFAYVQHEPLGAFVLRYIMSEIGLLVARVALETS